MIPQTIQNESHSQRFACMGRCRIAGYAVDEPQASREYCSVRPSWLKGSIRPSEAESPAIARDR
jgi:hypothetical protein